ncbi:hypothetical protein OUZ56_033940 [Daphnia magna]|uniref:Uncharacterized protein n=1 Tax=Daphnia magna TaxID=35525 RepID=A0ABR0BBB4_9CRUS|nr:hypothetical protein OUZ56_033940 [Daphnia magna]
MDQCEIMVECSHCMRISRSSILRNSKTLISEIGVMDQCEIRLLLRDRVFAPHVKSPKFNPPQLQFNHRKNTIGRVFALNVKSPEFNPPQLQDGYIQEDSLQNNIEH